MFTHLLCHSCCHFCLPCDECCFLHFAVESGVWFIPVVDRCPHTCPTLQHISHTPAHTRLHTLTCTHSPAHTHLHTLTCTHSPAHTLYTLTCTHLYALICTHSHTHSPAHTHSHTHSPAHTCTHLHSNLHTRTHSPTEINQESLWVCSVGRPQSAVDTTGVCS